jgi:hypothetical protein
MFLLLFHQRGTQESCISLLSDYCEKRPTISMFYGFSDLLAGTQPELGLSPTARHYPVVLALPATLTLSTSTLAEEGSKIARRTNAPFYCVTRDQPHVSRKQAPLITSWGKAHPPIRSFIHSITFIMHYHPALPPQEIHQLAQSY